MIVCTLLTDVSLARFTEMSFRIDIKGFLASYTIKSHLFIVVSYPCAYYRMVRFAHKVCRNFGNLKFRLPIKNTRFDGTLHTDLDVDIFHF